MIYFARLRLNRDQGEREEGGDGRTNMIAIGQEKEMVLGEERTSKQDMSNVNLRKEIGKVPWTREIHFSYFCLVVLCYFRLGLLILTSRSCICG